MIKKQDFINRFLQVLRMKKGRDLSSLEKNQAEHVAEKAWNFSIENQEVLNGD